MSNNINQSLADYLAELVNSTDDIKTAITAKGGTVGENDGLTSLASAIATIPSGGGGSYNDDVRFLDYDGTVVQSYSAADFANLSALPDNPTHTGLTAQGWNWTLADAKTYVAANGELNIGQQYVTNDGKTRIYINLSEGRISPLMMLYLNDNTELDIDWGDGSAHSTWTTTTEDYKSERHNYPDKGEYVIAIKVVSGSFILQSQQTSYNTFFTDGKNSSNSSDRAYLNSIQKIEIGTGISQIGNYAFYTCTSLSSITIPNGVTTIGSSAFNNCNSMDYIRFIGTTPPTVQGSNAWSNVSTSTIIYVPAESINAYKTATNYPNPSSYNYVGYATYASGDPLPTSIPGYSLTWYATIEDWIAGTNPITVGNGNEVYAKTTVVTSITREIDFVNNVTTRSTDAIEALNVYRNMKRCNVADDGTINAFYGDAGYTEDGSNGQVMVYVPKFYYKTNHTNSDGTSTTNGTGIDIGKWSIADTKLDNTFNLHPAFIGTDGTTELDYFLIGAFEAIAYDGTSYLDQTSIGTSTSYKLSSVGYVSGSPTYRPAHTFTRAVGRASAQRRGTGWYQTGFKQISAIQMLFTVELSCNSQKAVGYGITTLGTQTAFTNTSYVGSTVGNITGNATSTKNSNGTTYTTNGDVSVSYRGIENLWGNIWCWIDGLTMNGYTPYVNTSYTFTDDTTVGTQLAYNVPSSNNYQTKFGYDSSMDWVMLPYSSGAESDPNNAVIGDYVYVSSSSNRVALLGGYWGLGSSAGLFCWYLYADSSSSYTSIGSRLMFIPN